MNEVANTNCNAEPLDERLLEQILDGSKSNKNQLKEDSIKLTAEEVKQFEKAFENSEFRKLMKDYVTEISDPKHRKEQDEYIKQLESQQNIPEGKEIVRPSPSFVLKFKYAKKKKTSLPPKNEEKDETFRMKNKLFVNVVSSQKIDQPTCEKDSSGSSTPRTRWSIPYSLGPLSMELDKSDSLTPTFDCCFHPKALQLMKEISGFKDLLAKSAREGATKQFSIDGEDVLIDANFIILKGVTYKNGTPPVMIIASNSNKDAQNSQKKCVSRSKPSKTYLKEDTTWRKGFLKNSSNDFVKGNSVQPNQKYAPKYTLTERRAFDISENTLQNPNFNPNTPSHLVYRIDLPNVANISELEVDVSYERLVLETSHKSRSSPNLSYSLNLKLPYPAKCDDVTATWEKDTHKLTVTIPVSSHT